MNKKKEIPYKILRFLTYPFFKLLYPVKIINQKNIPQEGPLIFCGNHLNFKDQFPVIYSTKKVIHWMSKKEYFDGPFAFFFKLTGCICVDRQNHGGTSLDIAKNYLKNNSNIGIFPEGTRNRTKNDLLPFKIGAVYLAKETNATIIPFAISGDFKIRSKNTILRFGTPFKVDNTDDLTTANTKLYEEILALKRQNDQETRN